jgi:UDP-glucose 4-epimerase
MTKKILITGGSGYIGSVLAVNLEKKYSIYTLDKVDRNFFVKKKINYIKCNLLNYSKTRKIIEKIKPEIIIHLAAQSTVDFIISKKNLYDLNNIKATQNIVKISKNLKIKKFIFASTAAVYKYKNKPISERSDLIPENFYGKTKLKNEIFIQKLFKNSEVKFCILRFFNVCSADQKNKIGEFHSPETHLLPIVINKIIKNKDIYIYGHNYNTLDGTCVRDYIHVKDIVRAIIKSINYLDKNNIGLFNLGTENGVSVLKLINSCSKCLNIKPKIKFKKRRFGDIDRLTCQIKRAKKYLKWRPIYSNINKIIKDEIWWFNYLNFKKLNRKFYY